MNVRIRMTAISLIVALALPVFAWPGAARERRSEQGPEEVRVRRELPRAARRTLCSGQGRALGLRRALPFRRIDEPVLSRKDEGAGLQPPFVSCSDGAVCRSRGG